MLALRLHPGGELRIHDEATPTPGPGEALVPLITLRVPLPEAARGFASLVGRSGIQVVVEPATAGCAARA